MTRSWQAGAAVGLLLGSFLQGCNDDVAATAPAAAGPMASASSMPSSSAFVSTPRAPGVRAPLTAACDPMDGLRCALPWPSSRFLSAAPSTATGVQVDLPSSSVEWTDDTSPLNLEDGFSRVSPLIAGFPADLDDGSLADGVVLLINAQPGPAWATSLPVRLATIHSVDGDPVESLLTAYPLAPLEPGTDYVVAVTDGLTAGGAAIAPAPLAEVALGLTPPATQDEQNLADYHAPTRSVLAAAGVDPKHVLRVWDFTTRSQSDPTRWLATMQAATRQAVQQGTVTVVIDSVAVAPETAVSVAVEGRLQHTPTFVSGTTLSLDAQGDAQQTGERDAPFRVVIPVGTGDYPFVLYGHGAGGSYEETSFDVVLSQAGLAKVAMSFYGWTSTDIIDTLANFGEAFQGAMGSTAGLLEALADASALESALSGPLADALAAPTLAGTPNPAAGRRVMTTTPLWAGGSLGGTLGYVYASTSPTIHEAVLNVPGAAWTYFIPNSYIFDEIVPLVGSSYNSRLDLVRAVLMTQGLWDPVDGASFDKERAAKSYAFLIQESIGDPVLLNPGSAMVAVTSSASMVGQPIVAIPGLPLASQVAGASAITQYKVNQSLAPLDIHGFAAQNTPAGDAAQAQISAFLESALAGAPLITVPAGCPGGLCDFSAVTSP